MSEKDSSSSSRTDWDKIRSLTDDAIDTSDSPALGADFFAKAQLRMPSDSPVGVMVHLDPQVYAWFKTLGDDWEQRVNAALRLYAQAHQAYAPLRKTAG